MGQGRYFEDFRTGDRIGLGPALMDEAEMIAFARRFDPQPFHVDPRAAAETPMAGLIASGWMTAAVTMRLLCDAVPFGLPPILGRGVDALRWPAPVRPGDVLAGIAEVIEARPSATRPDRGTVRMRIEMRNQRGEAVFAMEPSMVVPRRGRGHEPPAAPE